MGSQLADSRPEKRYDGVLGVWYGKAPGLDRASDAIRHAVFAGTAHHGGVVAVVGDDPAAKSSTLPSSSDATIVDLHMPIIFPGDVQEALDLARHAVALVTGQRRVGRLQARHVGRRRHRHRRRPPRPRRARWCRRWSIRVAPSCPHPSGRLLTPYTLDMEREFQRGALGARPPVRRGQQAQPRHGRHRGRLDRHRRVRADLPRAARGAVVARVHERRVAAARRHPPAAAVDAGAARRRHRAPVRPRPAPRCSSSRRRTRPSSCS